MENPQASKSPKTTDKPSSKYPDSKSKSTKSNPTNPNSAPSTTVRASKYTIVGIILTVFNFGLYTIIARIINNNEFLWLATLISTLITTILAYILHSKITWKERNPGKSGIYKFFIWNIVAATIIGPIFTWLFTLITPLYEFTYNITATIHLPFDYNFVQSTGVFILTAIVSMVLNYLFYDRLVFGVSKPTKNHQPTNPTKFTKSPKS
ncbi:GtrA family protein [Candidatus Saccharibacteria bacterium]|nr:GtrA family protein [Candidatus Saccharibacteria bacterium]